MNTKSSQNPFRLITKIKCLSNRLLASMILTSLNNSHNLLNKKPKSLWKNTSLQWMTRKTLSSFCCRWSTSLTNSTRSFPILSWWSTRYFSLQFQQRQQGKSLKIFLLVISLRTNKWKFILWSTTIFFKLWLWGQRRSILKRSLSTFRKMSKLNACPSNC
jgi:hypothetical protein